MSVIVRPADLVEQAKALAEVRHQIHRHPEIGLCLPHTEAIIVENLQKFGVDEIARNVGGKDVTGVVAVIRGSRPGRTIGVRADFDALGLNEKSGKPWACTMEKHMHACGHDGHTSTLLAAVSWLCAHRDFAGTVCAIFQPGEEGYAGGRCMIEDGLIERFGIEEFYALHCDPSVPYGKVGFIPGYATANADIFDIRFEGKGGHGSRPHLSKDPVVAACEAVMAFQTIAARSVSPDDAAVVTVGSIQGGSPDSTSVIPQFATLRGTARSYEPHVQDIIEHRLEAISKGIAQAYEMNVEVNYQRMYPSMFNNPERVAEAMGLARESLGEENVLELKRSAEGEDFAFMLRAKPGLLFRLGMKDGDPCHESSLHSQTFDFNDNAIAIGASLLLTIALTRAAQ